MSKNLVNKVGEVGQDNLIAKLWPPAETFGIKIAGGEGELKRGTVLSLEEGGTYVVLDDDAAEANCILADDVDVDPSDETVAVAYRTGHFNRKALIVASGYKMTIEDEEALRKGGILLSDMMD